MGARRPRTTRSPLVTVAASCVRCYQPLRSRSTYDIRADLNLGVLLARHHETCGARRERQLAAAASASCVLCRQLFSCTDPGRVRQRLRDHFGSQHPKVNLPPSLQPDIKHSSRELHRIARRYPSVMYDAGQLEEHMTDAIMFALLDAIGDVSRRVADGSISREKVVNAVGVKEYGRMIRQLREGVAA